MGIIRSEHIFYGEMQVMYVNIRDKRPKNTKRAPSGKPKGRRTGPGTPNVSFFKDIFSFDN